jgi:hypothetical protein
MRSCRLAWPRRFQCDSGAGTLAGGRDGIHPGALFHHHRQKPAAFGRRVHHHPKPLPARANVREDTRRVFVKMKERRRPAVKESALPFREAFDFPQIGQQRLHRIQRGLANVFHLERLPYMIDFLE